MSTDPRRSSPTIVRVGCVIAVAWVASAPWREVSACDCPRAETPAEELGKAAAVFEGVTQPAGSRAEGAPHTDRFIVTRAWKGASAGADVTIVRGGGNCTFRFEPNVAYVVFAHRTPAGKLAASICSLTEPVDTGPARVTIAALGPPTSGAPVPAASTPPAVSAPAREAPPPPPPGPPTSDAPPRAPAASADPSTPSPQRAGCAGCESSGPRGGASWPVALAAVALGARRRRRREPARR